MTQGEVAASAKALGWEGSVGSSMCKKAHVAAEGEIGVNLEEAARRQLTQSMPTGHGRDWVVF